METILFSQEDESMKLEEKLLKENVEIRNKIMEIKSLKHLKQRNRGLKKELRMLTK